METGFFKSGDQLAGFFKGGDQLPQGWIRGCFRVKKDAPCLSLVCLAWCCPVFRSPSFFFEIQTVRGFSCTGVAFLFLSRLPKVKKKTEGHSTAAVGGLQTGLATGQG